MTILQPETATSTAFEKLARMIAAVASFQERCGLDDADETYAKHVFYPEMRDEHQSIRPFVVITPAEGGGGIRWNAMGSSADTSVDMMCSGSMNVAIGDDYIPESDGRGSLMDFLNFRDQVIEGIVSQNGLDDNLVIKTIEEIQEPMRSDDEVVAGDIAQKPYFDCVLRIEWGPVDV